MRKELAAHSVAKYGALARQKISTGNYITTLGEVTRGHMGGANTMYAIDAPLNFKHSKLNQSGVFYSLFS